MKKRSVNFTLITFIAFIISASALAEKVFLKEEAGDYFRMKFYSSKELLKVNKINNKIYVKTLNDDLYQNLKKDLMNLKNSKIKSIEKNLPSEGNNVFGFTITLNEDIEIFTFYKEREKAYFVDLWKDENEISQKSAAVKAPAPKVVKQSPAKKIAKVQKKRVVRLKPSKVKKVVNKELPYRDYRYGAPFIYNYEALIPDLKDFIDLSRKTPEYFYPIKDRNFEESDKEAHMQLSVNFYKKRKYGLMYKSIKLYEKKYGEDENYSFNEYLKANALLRESRDKGDLKPIQTSISMFSNIVDRTKDYELRKGLSKYMIQFFLAKDDYIQTLKYAKRFFADAKENFDYEELEHASELMFHCLAKLNQTEQIEELAREKTINKIISKQKILAYELYSLLNNNKEDQAISNYEKFVTKNTGVLLPSIYFNVGEAYFRNSDYDKAIKIYDELLDKHSYHSGSSKARVRIAHAYEILGKNFSETLALYKNAINRSQDKDASFEAKLRYVSLRTIRKKEPTKEDIETRVFIEADDKTKLNDDLQELLWLVRLRTFIVDKEYNKALSFLTALPLTSMKAEIKKVFHGDGAEIVFGIIQKNYNQNKFSRAIRAWEIYKEIYFSKVAMDPSIQFIIAKSYLNLGLWDGFERIYSNLASADNVKVRSYPIWLKRQEIDGRNAILSELKLIRNIKLKNWDTVSRLISQMKSRKSSSAKAIFYQALASFEMKKYKDAESSFETFFAKSSNFNSIDGNDLILSVGNYLESIYKLIKKDKFLEVSQALLKDVQKIGDNAQALQNLKERVGYLRSEILFSSLSPKAENEAKAFLDEYEKSEYRNRVKYLYGRHLIKINKDDEGKKFLNELVNDKDTEPYIKEMAKSELTLLNLRNRSI